MKSISFPSSVIQVAVEKSSYTQIPYLLCDRLCFVFNVLDPCRIVFASFVICSISVVPWLGESGVKERTFLPCFRFVVFLLLFIVRWFSRHRLFRFSHVHFLGATRASETRVKSQLVISRAFFKVRYIVLNWYLFSIRKWLPKVLPKILSESEAGISS